MKVKHSFFVLLFVVFQINLTKAQTSFNKVDSLLTELEDNNITIGSISIFKEGKEVYNRSFGQKNLPNEPFRKNSRYQIGSITKMVTATLIFKLIEENKLSLGTKLMQFYPEIPNAEKITIKHMLEHSSGLGDYVSKDGDETWLISRVSHQDIMNEIIRQDVLFQPNEKIEYSNSAYYLLAKIVEELYKKRYSSIVDKEIAKPLKLKNFKSYTSKQDKVFESYRFSDKWVTIKDFAFSNVIGVGDITSTSHDLNVFIRGLFNNKLLKEESLVIMKPDSIGDVYFGRGMHKIPFYNTLFLGHEGDTYGTHALVGYNENLDLSTSIVLNASGIHYKKIYFAILSKLFNINYELPNHSKIQLSTEDLDMFIGTYTNTEISLEVFVFKDGNSLKAEATGQDSFVLNCYEENNFINEEGNIKIYFDINQSKFTLDQNGEKYIFIKKQ